MDYSVIEKKRVNGKLEIETPKNIWIDDFVCLRSKMYSFRCRDVRKNKLKGNSESQLKHIKFEEYKKSVGGGENQRECNNKILSSINHEIYLQEIKKSTLSTFDDKRCYINETESIPWN